MKKKRIFLIVLIGVLLLGLTLFYMPKSKQATMWACTMSDETALVEIDIKIYRRLFGEDEVRGTIFLNGEEYIDSESFIKMLPTKQKHQASKQNGDFCKKTDGQIVQGITKMALNRISIVYADRHFDKMIISYMDETMQDENGLIEGVFYLWPAKTVQEAEVIAAQFGAIVR